MKCSELISKGWNWLRNDIKRWEVIRSDMEEIRIDPNTLEMVRIDKNRCGVMRIDPKRLTTPEAKLLSDLMKEHLNRPGTI